MKNVYVAGRYRGKSEYEVTQNIRAAEDVGVALLRAGHVPWIPHKAFAYLGGAADDSVFLNADLWLMRKCDAVVVVPGWETSSGTKAEIAEAEKRGIPVFYWPDTPST